jgi:hypothetical protein
MASLGLVFKLAFIGIEGLGTFGYEFFMIRMAAKLHAFKISQKPAVFIFFGFADRMGRKIVGGFAVGKIGFPKTVKLLLLFCFFLKPAPHFLAFAYGSPK